MSKKKDKQKPKQPTQKPGDPASADQQFPIKILPPGKGDDGR